jgi:hypothetical protein
MLYAGTFEERRVQASVGCILLWWHSWSLGISRFPAIRWRGFSTCKAEDTLNPTSSVLPGTQLLQPSNPACHVCRCSINNADYLRIPVRFLVITDLLSSFNPTFTKRIIEAPPESIPRVRLDRASANINMDGNPTSSIAGHWHILDNHPHTRPWNNIVIPRH